MFDLQPSYDRSSEDFIEDEELVAKALSEIHEKLDVDLILEVITASNLKNQHINYYSPPNCSIQMWQINITTFLREKLSNIGWSVVNKSGVAYAVSPCKRHAIRVFAGNEYVGNREGAVSNSAMKGQTLSNDISSLSFGHEEETIIWTLLFHQRGSVISLELSQPNAFKNGRVISWNTRIKIPNVNFDLPDTPLAKQDKAEVGSVPVRRRKSG